MKKAATDIPIVWPILMREGARDHYRLDYTNDRRENNVNTTPKANDGLRR